MLLTLATLLGLGILHGLGPDHCLAIASLAAGGGLRRALAVSLRFGVGHTLVLAVGALVTTLLGWTIPLRWESVLEAMGGASLAVLGLWTVFGHGSMRVPHVHLAGDATHADNVGRASSEASKGGVAAGAVFGLSGVRGLLLVIPLAARRSAMVSMAGVVLFGAGVVVSMLGVGLLTHSAERFVGQGARVLRTLVGVAATLVGVYWVLGHVSA